MVYVPPPPSPRARELGQRVLDVIEAYRKEHPNVTWIEIHQALRLASRRSGADRRRLVLALVAGAVLFVVLLVGYLKEGSATSGRVPAVLIAVLVALAGLALVVFRLRR